jgi:hypothetical protein
VNANPNVIDDVIEKLDDKDYTWLTDHNAELFIFLSNLENVSSVMQQLENRMKLGLQSIDGGMTQLLDLTCNIDDIDAAWRPVSRR